METCATAKGMETSGEGYATAKSLKAAAGPHGLCAGYSTKGKAGSGLEETLAVAAAAAAMAKQAMEAAHQAMAMAAEAGKKAAEAAKQAAEDKQAAAAAAAEAKQAAAEVEAKQSAEEAKQAEEAAAVSDTDDDDSEDEEGGMTSLEYITTYKQLPQHEVEAILANPVKRTPFTDTDEFKELCADPSTTQYDIDDAFAEHQARLDSRERFHEYVRIEYEAKGYVAVSDEYVARRARIEEFCSRVWEEAVAEMFGDDGESEEEADH